MKLPNTNITPMTRRKVMSNAGACTAALAAPMLMLPTAARANWDDGDRVYKKYDNFLETERWVKVDLQRTGTDAGYFYTDAGNQYAVYGKHTSLAGRIAVYKITDLKTGAMELNSFWDEDDRELPEPSLAPWKLAAGLTLLASSHINHLWTLGWMKYKEPTSYGSKGYRIVAQYWVWDNARLKWLVRKATLVNADGVDQATNVTWHGTYVNTCNLFSNRINSMLTQVASYLIGGYMVLITSKELPIGRVTTAAFGLLSMGSYAIYDIINASAGYAETIMAQVKTASHFEVAA